MSSNAKEDAKIAAKLTTVLPKESGVKVGVVGLGLIGGSIALELKANHFASEVWGVDANPRHAEEALALKLVDSMTNLENGCKEVDLLILATPVNSIARLLPQVLD